MIYQPKPQRGGRSISVNTNNPPQDPPPPPVETTIETESPIEVNAPVEIIKPIKVVTPKVTKKVTPKKTVKVPKKAHIVPVIRLTLRQKISRFLKKIFRRI